VFAARGYHGASLEDVAGAAGLTKGAVYSSFSSKDELFYALMHERIDERISLVKDANGEESATEEIANAGRDLTKLMDSQSDWHRLFIEFWAQAIRDPQRRDELARHRRSARELIASFLEREAAAHATALPAPADQLAVAVLALSNGIAIEHLADPGTVDPATLGTALGLLLRVTE
jgi:AcrR family transcriptional regulator